MFILRWAAWLLALILVLGVAGFESQDAPLVQRCGSVSGGQTITAKGIKVARAAGEWVRETATREPPTENEVRRYVDGVARDVLWYWFRTFILSSNGQKIDPQILRLEQESDAAQKAAEESCTPCPPAQPSAPDNAPEEDQAPTGPPVDTIALAGNSSRSSSSSGSQKADIEREALRYPWNPRIAVAIAGAESTYRADPPNPPVVNGSTMRGAYQINQVPHKDLFPPNTSRDWRSIADNTWMAYQVYKQAGGSWLPWSTYTSGSYKSHLDSDIPTQGSGAAPDRNSSGGRAQVDIPELEGGQAESPLPGCATGGGSVGAVIGSWNVLKSNSSGNIAAGVRDLISGGATVFGLQEMGDESKRAAAARAASGYTMTTDRTAVPILYKSSQYTAKESGRQLAFPDGQRVEAGVDGTIVGPKYVTWIHLTDNSTGQDLAVVNTHMLPSVQSGGKLDKSKPRRVALYRKQAAVVNGIVAGFRAKGIPVTVVGDMNYSGKPPGFEGVVSNWATLNGPATHGKRYIDHALSAGMSPNSQRTLPAHGSDHRPLLVTYLGDAPNRVEADSTGSVSYSGKGPRVITDPSSKLTYRIPIPAGPRGVAMNFALDQLGERYVFGPGGIGLDDPRESDPKMQIWDCSSLTAGAWKAAGVKLTPQSGVQNRTIPHASKMTPGDILWHPGHVQIYLGKIGGQQLIVEAPNPRAKVRIVPQWGAVDAILDPTKLGTAA